MLAKDQCILFFLNNKEDGVNSAIYLYGSVLSEFFKQMSWVTSIYLWLHWVFAASHRRSLVAMNGSHSLIALHRLLIAVAGLLAEHGF